MVLISAMFPRFLLDSFELQEMVGLTKHGATFSCPASRGVLTAQVMMNMLAVQLFFQMLETEESVSEIDSHYILQEASEL